MRVYLKDSETMRDHLILLTDWGRDPAQALALHPKRAFAGLDNYARLFTGRGVKLPAQALHSGWLGATGLGCGP